MAAPRNCRNFGAGVGQPRALLVTDSFQPEAVTRLIDALRAAELKLHLSFPSAANPRVEVIDEAKAIATSAGCDMVISIGGGSVIDSGKASRRAHP